MNAMKSGFALGFLTMIGWVAYNHFRDYAKSRHSPSGTHPAVTQWEGEGGNVPDVSIQSGQQARAPTGTAALPDTPPVASNPDQHR